MTDHSQPARIRAAVACEMLKHARIAWVTRPELAKELGVKVDTVTRWVAEFAENGMLVERMRTPGGACGSAPMEYRLAPEWGGEAEPPAAEPKPVEIQVIPPEPEDTEPLPADPKWQAFSSVPPGVNPATGMAWAAMAGEPA